MEVLKTLIQNSYTFNEKNEFPIQTVRLKELVKRYPEKIESMKDFALGARPLIHEDVLLLINDFLTLKMKSGSSIEKRIYNDMSLPNFVNRLLTKRPLVFMGRRDSYLLRDGEGKGNGGFESIGRDKAERFPLIMDKYLTYDEIKISALLGTSSHTLAINKGDRFNKGRVDADEEFVNEALIIGLVGPRFQKKGFMEYQDTIISNSKDVKPFGKDLYQRLYRVAKFSSIEEASEMNDDHMIRLKNDLYFDKIIYKRRIEITAETLLREANHRAEVLNKKAYVHIVGLGLGVWRLCSEQLQIYVDVFGNFISKNSLCQISDIDFSWISVKSVCGTPNNGTINGIKIHLSKRNFFDVLPPQDKNKLLVVSWAYDGNSYPGNEFWNGKLSGSGDSQAASSTQVTELHNPLINPWFNADNLHVVSRQHNGVFKYTDYLNK
ncbi:uncharacterized protein [Lepeophtheirus salmonis]|uniref:uncharacterized protein n=1 Tax=Lepeophtheirus salmonis TaxID=72036 RepID=UPI001AE980C4|nr:uncharacterized protein LOC121122161 [Lepeophtheirus salmonis]